ncbi:DUF1302 domain-containing protein [Ramlibacter solisilvae]|uniref:DUF1302 domain-containing protein n=2 Tax=Ramlibacter tataouinensis TaxID=94132 RepID=A0A127JWM2_9BURK|nr:hypothetical protein UC35_18150 [Ramlibacter tataouinensis]
MIRLSAVLLLLPGGLSVHAVEYEVAGGKLTVTGSVTAGGSWRTDSQDTTLLPNVNSSQVGIVGNAITPAAGRNQDDGNLNYSKGDPVSQVMNGYLALEYKQGAYGAAASVKAWYDYLLEHGGVPWGNIPNRYTPDASLGDGGAQPRTQFSGVAIDNLKVFGRNEVGGLPLDWTLGWQKLDWGNRLLVIGGLRDLNPIDIPALTRPGMLQRDQETRIPVPQIFAKLGVSKSTSIEGFYQFHFERNAPNQCGTFYTAVDYFSDGCNAVTLGNDSDRVALATGNFIPRAPNVMPSNSGQGGLAVLHTVDEWDTKFGLYATRFHSRAGFSGIYKSLRAGAPFLPNDPGGLNPRYFTEFPEGINMFGGSFETKVKGGLIFGELTYRPNQPLQFNAADLVAAAVSNVAPTPLRARMNALGPGGTLSGFERHKNVQFQLGEVGQVPKVLGAAGLNWGAEVVYKGVPDLPDPSVTRFGRSDIFGQGPVNGVCPPPAVAIQCTTDGYVSRHAWGYRVFGGLRYANVADGVDLVPAILFGQDVKGWSGDAGILEGRKLVLASLRAVFRGGFVAEVAWFPTWGGTYNNQRDRSAIQVFVGQRF